MNISISAKISAVCPQFTLAAIQCTVKNSKHQAELWDEIEEFSTEFRAKYKISDINKLPNLSETRAVYKALGKEPNRYRPSGEALLRRISKGMSLYQIDTLVDLINLISMRYRYSIGGFDADKIKGDLLLGVGEKDEKFEAIGRGLLNIENMPVYRDAIGGIGTPSSDEERTKITDNTSNLLLIINGYSGKDGLAETIDYSLKLLKKYAEADNFKIRLIDKDSKRGYSA